MFTLLFRSTCHLHTPSVRTPESLTMRSIQFRGTNYAVHLIPWYKLHELSNLVVLITRNILFWGTLIFRRFTHHEVRLFAGGSSRPRRHPRSRGRRATPIRRALDTHPMHPSTVPTPHTLPVSLMRFRISVWFRFGGVQGL